MQADLPTSPPENLSAPRGGTGYSVFISSFSITSLVCEANGWPHLQGLFVSFITVTETNYSVAQTRSRDYADGFGAGIRLSVGAK